VRFSHPVSDFVLSCLFSVPLFKIPHVSNLLTPFRSQSLPLWSLRHLSVNHILDRSHSHDLIELHVAVTLDLDLNLISITICINLISTRRAVRRPILRTRSMRTVSNGFQSMSIWLVPIISDSQL
jgi:hypothetical protein